MFIFLDVWHGLKRVATDDIYLVKAFDKGTILYLTDGTEIDSKHLLHQLCEMLPQSFVQIHRSYAVNVLYVTDFKSQNREIILENRQKIPISKRRIVEFVDRWKSISS